MPKIQSWWATPLPARLSPNLAHKPTCVLLLAASVFGDPLDVLSEKRTCRTLQLEQWVRTSLCHGDREIRRLDVDGSVSGQDDKGTSGSGGGNDTTYFSCDQVGYLHLLYTFSIVGELCLYSSSRSLFPVTITYDER